jgi:hypothetical protein
MAPPPGVKEEADPSDATEASTVTEVRAPIGSEADEDDDSVTRQAPVPRPSDVDDDDEPDSSEQTLTREAPAPGIDVAMDDDDGEDDLTEDAVTEIAPLPAMVLPPGSDESVTEDRPPVGKAAGPAPPRPSPQASFPSPLELPGPMVAAPQGSRRVVAVEPIDGEEVLGETLQAVPEDLVLPVAPAPEQPFVYDEELPPQPSYKKLGIAIGIAFFAAFALLVFVIIRAATQDDVVADQIPTARVKARHVVELPPQDDELAPKKRRFPPRWR